MELLESFHNAKIVQDSIMKILLELSQRSFSYDYAQTLPKLKDIRPVQVTEEDIGVTQLVTT